MAVIRNLVVKIAADISSLSAGLKTAEKKLKGISSTFGKIGGTLTIKIPNTGEVICTHKIPNSQNNNVLLEENERREPVAENYLLTMFSHNISMLKFMENMKAQQPRYYYESCARLGRLTNYYSDKELTEAAEYCVEASKCCLSELVYRHGADRAKPFAYQSLLFNYKERATKIKEELN